MDINELVRLSKLGDQRKYHMWFMFYILNAITDSALLLSSINFYVVF